jgi:WXG100 family type VII secretion target
MAHVNFDPRELEQLRRIYAEIARETQQRLDQLKRRSAALREDWVGSPAAHLQQLNAQLEASQVQLIEALDGISRALAAAVQAYHGADSSIRSALE